MKKEFIEVITLGFELVPDYNMLDFHFMFYDLIHEKSHKNKDLQNKAQNSMHHNKKLSP